MELEKERGKGLEIILKSGDIEGDKDWSWRYSERGR